MIFQIQNGALDVSSIYARCFDEFGHKNLGAFVSFCGIVREENGISGLYFEIYDSLLKSWFEKWQQKVDEAMLCFVHTRGFVGVGESSYFAAVASSHRALSLRLITDFVEDFKQNAPIWKFDVKNDKKIYAKERSFKLENAGLLS